MREGGSGSGGREGRLRKGTSDDGRDGAKERGQGGSEWREEGATEQEREESEERGRKGDREGGKLQGRYPEEDTGQYTLYSRERTKQHTMRPLPLILWYYGYCDASKCIV